MIENDRLARAYERGLRHEKSGRADLAEKAYRECLALDPADHGGVSVRLAALGRADVPERAPAAYVETLFDQHAEVFDDILVEQLGYCVPLMVRAGLDRVGAGPFARMLDLGCGTGLAGGALRDRCDHISGVDLAEQMVAVADERDVYDDLYVGDAIAFVQDWDEAPFDLVTATDMLPYLGALEALMSAVSAVLVEGGLFVFSTETLPDTAFGDLDYVVGRHHRFHHRLGYVESTALAAGFTLLGDEEIVVRHDEGEPQPGHLVMIRKGAGPLR